MHYHIENKYGIHMLDSLTNYNTTVDISYRCVGAPKRDYPVEYIQRYEDLFIDNLLNYIKRTFCIDRFELYHDNIDRITTADIIVRISYHHDLTLQSFSVFCDCIVRAYCEALDTIFGYDDFGLYVNSKVKEKIMNSYIDYTSAYRGSNKTMTMLEQWSAKHFDIKKVIFNAPATIVIWSDGTKTVVKCGDEDIYDPEKGLAMCFTKRALGNKGNYYNTIKKYLKDNRIELGSFNLDIPTNGDTWNYIANCLLPSFKK